MYAFRDTLDPVELAFTDRLGGVSAAPFDSLNLGINTGDDPSAVARNLRLVLADFGGTTATGMHQVHGADVVTVPGPDPAPTCDALVTTSPGHVLVVRVADCVPVLLADRQARVVGAAHAGRNGVMSGVVPATVERMRDLGARELTAWIGPHVCGACYEVPAEMQEDVAAVVPATRSTTRQGTPGLDLGAGVRAQLASLDVAVRDVSRCTIESPDLYSHRRDGAGAGRFAGLVRLAT